MAGRGTSLGFLRSPACLPVSTGCPTFPLIDVRICIVVNSATMVTIQTGCPVTPGDTTAPCPVSWQNGVSEDSWGKESRVMNWTQSVPAGKFIRILFCAKGSCATLAAGCSTPIDSAGTAVVNQIRSFTIDGEQITGLLDFTATQASGQVGCCEFACQQAGGSLTPSCCTYTQSSTEELYQPNGRTNNVPIGALVIVGPLGSPSLFAA